MKPSRLKPRCVVKHIEDPDWYMKAYLRAAARFDYEEKRGDAKSLEHIARRLQALYDKIVQELEGDRQKTEKAKAAAIAINHALTDYHLPRAMTRNYEGRGG
jgi:hypothetical protein